LAATAGLNVSFSGGDHSARINHTMSIRLIDLSSTRAKAITQFDSRGATSIELAHGHGASHAYLVQLAPGGAIGPHPAGFDQVFMAIRGSGWVAASDGVRVAIGDNVAAVIARGESHSKGSETGMLAVMIQADHFDFPLLQASPPMPTISRPRIEDALAMHLLQRRAFAEEGRRSGTTDIPPLTETEEGIAGHILTQTALVARDGDAIIGSVRGVVNDGICTIRALVVDPAHHGRGIGSSLLRALEAALPDVKRFELTTNMVMQNNVPFYERHGYVVYEKVRHSDIITLALMSKPARRVGDA